MKPIDEAKYITRILDGDTELFAFFLDRYSRPVYSLIIQLVSSPEDAEEITQDVFLKAYRSLSSYKRECLFSTWLYRIAYNMAISALRRKKQEYVCVDENTINNVSDGKADELLIISDDEERIEKLSLAVGLLTAEERALITLFYYEEKSQEEISEILKLSIANVKVKLHRTRKKIYVLMNEGYGNK